MCGRLSASTATTSTRMPARPARDVQWPRRRLRRPSRRGRRAGAVLSRRRRRRMGRARERNDARVQRACRYAVRAATATIRCPRCTRRRSRSATHGRRLRYRRRRRPRADVVSRARALAACVGGHCQTLACTAPYFSCDTPSGCDADLTSGQTCGQLHESLFERRLVVRAGPLVSATVLRVGCRSEARRAAMGSTRSCTHPRAMWC